MRLQLPLVGIICPNQWYTQPGGILLHRTYSTFQLPIFWVRALPIGVAHNHQEFTQYLGNSLRFSCGVPSHLNGLLVFFVPSHPYYG